MSSFKNHRHHLLALAIASLLPLGTVQACGPGFPHRLLEDRSQTLKELPEGSFEFEIRRISQPIPGLGQAGEATFDRYFEAPDPRDSESRTASEKQQLSPKYFSLVSRLRDLTDARQAEIEGAELPPELRLYTAGAVAFTQYDMALAADYFRRVLALPAAERPLRSTWAAYSLGRALAVLAISAPNSMLDDVAALQRQHDLRQQAQAAFRQARELSIAGLADPLELGIASLGEEARLAMDDGNWDAAIHLYTSQFLHGSSTGYSSLGYVYGRLYQMNDEELRPLLGSPEVQQFVAAKLFSQLYGYSSKTPPPRLLRLLQETSIQPQIADRLAALSYQLGDYAAARRFVEQAGGSGLAWWLRAKLALQDGDKAAATEAYAEAAKAFPMEEDWGTRVRPGYEKLKPRCRVEGEMAILALERGDYLEAFDQLYHSGEIYWQDSAEVAERVLTSNELKDYVDNKVPANGERLSAWDRPPVTALRELLGRRLLREGRYAEAVPYFASAELQEAARQYGAAREQAADAWTAIGRAESYYRAAKLAREQGMELLGYELSPDEAWSGGAFGNEFGKPLQADGLLTAAEAERQNASAAEPNRRYHYRWVAADLASQAADLLPARSQSFAATLCKATGWLINNDYPAARRYYLRYVEQGAYVPWGGAFGSNACQEPDFERASQLLWSEREQAVRQALRPYKYWLPLGLLLIVAAGIYGRQRRRALAIVDKTAEESRNE
ncbi:hypothetical protein [Aquipseudomonas ullengensis]|uniref:Tetratricopeptide repeat-containing protein n=1 Tax=Aquipseudomonas ullengensis TaxID=2759166 RepID=A0A7W4QCV2_9GAMM|nr:hypothetical protein [Pseudomonas ullengensis]MBB2495376.1 hypothetical protein [Pseudomonas ullengensis]